MLDRYLLFYKPYDVLSQFTDADPLPDRGQFRQAKSSQVQSKAQSSSVQSSPAESSPAESSPTQSRRTLKDFISVPHVYPVGRLDRDSEGLLLLTNNGQVQHRLSDPRFQHPRTYWVQVDRIPDEAALEQLRRGVRIQDYQTRPAQVRLLPLEPDLPPRDPPIRFRKSVPTAWLEITLTEGKNRQVRRMTAAVGFPTLRLVRVAIAQLKLEGLAPGQWRDLTAAEQRLILSKHL